MKETRTIRSRVVGLIAWVAVLALALAACSDGDGPTAEEPSDAETSAADDAEDSDGSEESDSGQDSESDEAGESAADGTDALYAAAAEEPTLIWYTAQVPDRSEATIEAFRERYPDVEVDFLRLASGDLTTRYASERSAGADPAGLVTTSAPNFFEDGFEEGWFEPELDVPELQDWPEEWYSGGLALVGILPYYVSYNTDLVDEADVPSTWEDLLNPAFKDDFLLGDPTAVFGYLALANLLRDEYGDDFLSGLAEQNFETVPSVVPGSQTLAAGGAAILAPNVPIVTEPLAAEGAPIEVVLLTPTTGSEYETAVAADTASPNAARLFFNYLLSDEGQTVFNGEFGSSPLGEELGLTPIPDGYQRPDFDAAEENREELLGLLGLG